MDEPTALLPPVSTRSLDELVSERGALSVEQAMLLLTAVAQALVKAVEARGAQPPLTVHTVRVSRLDEGDPVVILTEGEGTIDLSPGAAVFSLGIVAFTVLVGRPPRLDETLADAMPHVPAGVDRLVSKLLSRLVVERPSPGQALRLFTELQQTLAEPSVKAAAPLSAPPQIKRGPPIGDLRTDAKAWALDEEGTRRVEPKALQKTSNERNPFADDEATATVRGPLSSDVDDDERTRREVDLSATYKRPGFRTGDRQPLAPPVPTPSPLERAGPTRAAVTASEDEPFEATKGDLLGRTPGPARDPKLPVRKPRKPATPLEQLLATAKRQPPWVWGAIGVGLAFVVLLLIAIAR